jgi:hypothetical protein
MDEKIIKIQKRPEKWRKILKTLINERNSCIFKCKLLFQKAHNEQNSLRKSVLVSKRGNSYIDVVVMVLATMMVLAIAINVFGLFMQKQKLDYFAKELLNTVGTYGRISTEVDNRYNELASQTGLSPTVAWTASYYDNASKEVQLGDTITLALTLTANFKGTGEFLPIPVTLISGGSTLSQRYWKIGV